MLTLDERLKRSQERTKRLEAEKREKDQRAASAKRKQDAVRHRLIGELIAAHFPEVSQYQPKRTKAENKAEFAELDAVLSLLAEDKEYVSRLVEQARAMLRQER